jgi:hypothetical protein
MLRFLALMVSGLLLVTGCGLAPTSGVRPADAPPTGAASGPRVDVVGARADLAALPIKGRAPMTGYDRDAFGPAWSDATDAPSGHNGCDTRNDVLRRDLTDLVLKPDTRGCTVLSGTLRDPYGASTLHFVRGVTTSSAVQIDHVVALSDAWQKGAQRWSAEKRKAFANDPRELLAVDGRLNAAKRDGDAATWLPPYKPFRCAYVARQASVKRLYGLWVTQAEHDAMARVLEGCAA